MRKEAQVHMLPTEDKSILYKRNDTNELHLGDFNYCESDDKLRTNQHLYITTDEEIKEGDWVYWTDPEGLTSDINQVVSVDEEMIFISHPEHSETEALPHECRKIIATTDTELHYNKVVEEDMHMYKESLPLIPQHIIEAYVKKPFDEVLVEYKEYIKCTNCNLTEEDCECNVSYTQDLIGIDRVKLNPDNTIIIHPVEEMYTADSINTLRKLANAIIGPASEILPDTYDKELKAYWDWIEENL